jgi:hypothetical protein
MSASIGEGALGEDDWSGEDDAATSAKLGSEAPSREADGVAGSDSSGAPSAELSTEAFTDASGSFFFDMVVSW